VGVSRQGVIEPINISPLPKYAESPRHIGEMLAGIPSKRLYKKNGTAFALTVTNQIIFVTY
jgi:hypothetical protein